MDRHDSSPDRPETVWRRLVDEASDGAYLVRPKRDAEGVVVDFVFDYLNRAGEAQLGLPSESVVGRGLCELFPVHRELGLFDDYVQVLEGGPSLHREVKVPGLRTGTMWYQQHVFRVGDGLAFLSRDVTHQKLNEKARREIERFATQAQRLTSVGMLAGAIAHDFNNLLVAIGGFAELAELDTLNPTSVRQALTEIRRATQRGATLTKRLLSFSGRDKTSAKPVLVDTLLDEQRALIARLAGAGVELEFDLRAPDVRVMGDETQLLQALINLTTNGRDATAGHGRLVFRTEERRVTTDADRLTPDEPNGRYLRLTVSDDGRGMPESVQRRIFEPFFTTKEVTEGTGLGLAIVFWVVRSHNGVVAVDSAPERGTTFRIDLPACDDAIPDVAPSDEEAAWRPLPAGSTVLVVDDEQPVRVLVAAALARDGHRALVASDGNEALEVYRRHQGEIDVVLLDAVMPGPSGYETFVALREVDPEVRVLFSTGYEHDVFPPGFLDRESVLLLRKPYDLPALIGALGTAARRPTS